MTRMNSERRARNAELEASSSALRVPGSALDPIIDHFTASDGYRLHFRHWPAAAEQPRGYIVALHGIQSHSGWYEYSSERLARAGFDVRFLDRRGSGLNQESRGDAPHLDRLINDVVQFLKQVGHVRRQQNSSGPVILLGVSWGGKLAAVTAARRPELVDALALLYPGLCAKVTATRWQRLQLRLAEIVGIRDKLVRVPLDDPALFTGDLDWQTFVRDDAVSLRQVTVAFLLANRELDRLAADAPSQLRMPLLLMLAGRDRIIDNEATRRYFDRIASPARRLMEYPAAAHTLEFEPDRERFVDDLIEWLNGLMVEG